MSGVAANPADLYATATRRCIIELDVPGMRKLHTHMSPHLPGAGTDRDVLVSLHYARTQLQTAPLKLRAYSHRWLCDNGYPSGLPDELKPRAEQICPRVTPATGFALIFGSPILKPITEQVETAVHEVILDAYGTDKVHEIDHGKLRKGMLETKDITIRKLVGGIAKA